MDEKIKNFLEKWDAMLAAANEIKEFKYEFKVSVTSDNKYLSEREMMINGVNAAFVNNNMKYTSSSSN